MNKPYFLGAGLLCTGSSKAWLGGFGELMQAASSSGGIPSGLIAIWSGASTAIPDGWWLCNGENGTPDLRDRFVVGAGSSYAVAATGGSNTVTLSTSQMPSHNHSIILFSSKGSNMLSTGLGLSYSGGVVAVSASSSDYQTAYSQFITSTGSGTAHENRPPYYALCYIMKS